MARILVGIDINPMDDEQVALCQLAQKHLHLSAKEIASSFERVGSGDSEAEDLDERDGNDLSETHAHDFISSDRAVLEGDNADTGRLKDEGGDEDSRYFPAANLDESFASEDVESGFEGEAKNNDQIATSPSTSTISMNIDVRRETSFGTCKQERTDLATQNSLTTSSAAALEPESSAAFANLEAVSKTPFEEGSRMFQDLVTCPKAINEEANESRSLPQEAFNPPRFQDLAFGGSSSAVPFVGSEASPSTLPEPVPEPVSTGNFDPPRFQDFKFGGSSSAVPFLGSEIKPFTSPERTSEPVSNSIFNISNISSTQAPQNTFYPPPFGQDFTFGGNNSKVSFTASQQTSSNPPVPVPEFSSANASSVPGTSVAQDVSSVIPQNEEIATEEETSNTDTVGKECAENNAPKLNTPNKKIPRGKNSKEEAQNNEEPRKENPKIDSLNRGQRRAASQERKAAEKKAQAQANTAAHRGRCAVAMAMMGE